MTDLLLVNPNREQMPWPVIPVGICLVASAVERAGFSVKVLDLTFSRRSKLRAATQRAARQHQPQLIGVGVRNLDNANFESPVFYLDEVRSVILAAREAARSAKVLIGGAGANIAPAEVRAYLDADLAVVGEGEEVMPSLLETLARGGSPEQVDGVLTRQGPEEVGCRRVPRLTDDLRSRANRWVDLRPYQQRGASYPVQTKRGCALRCSYCVYNQIEGRRYRLRDPAAIIDEIEEAVYAAGVERIEFVDSTFNLPRAHALAVCEALARRALPVRVTTMGLNPIGVDDELISAMRRAGFDSVMCGAESASDVVLEGLQKDYDKGVVIAAARALRRAKMRTFWFFLLGGPGETMSTMQETLDFCDQHIPAEDVVLLATGIRVYPKTPLAAQLRQSGWLRSDDPLLRPSWYISPQLDLEQVYSQLVRAAAAHSNWMTNAETILSPPLATLFKRALRAFGSRKPFWTYIPQLFTITGRIGARQRTLAANEARVAERREAIAGRRGRNRADGG